MQGGARVGWMPGGARVGWIPRLSRTPAGGPGNHVVPDYLQVVVEQEVGRWAPGSLLCLYGAHPGHDRSPKASESG